MHYGHGEMHYGHGEMHYGHGEMHYGHGEMHYGHDINSGCCKTSTALEGTVLHPPPHLPQCPPGGATSSHLASSFPRTVPGTNKANKILGFLRRKLKIGNRKTKETVYKALARPIPEFAASVWDPYLASDIQAIEKVQRRAARWVTNRHRQTSCVSSILTSRSWYPIQIFEIFALLTLVYTYTLTHAQTRTEFVNALLDSYDNAVPPDFDLGQHTNVEVALYINSIDSINEQTMDFSMNAFVTQVWRDSRLQFYGLIPAEYLELDSKLISKFWVPDLYVSNEKEASFHSVTVPNKMLHLYSNGTVIYKIRLSLTASCPMDLQKYPMDTQTCTLFLRSFAFSRSYLQFWWRSQDSMRFNTQMVLPQFRLVDLQPSNCSLRDQNDDYFGNFTCIGVTLYLQRNLGYYLITIYIPSVLIVMLSWVSFWLAVDAVPARISLGILTVLTMTTQTSLAVSSLPKVSYVKAIDIWMATCLSFVFSSLLEFALVNVLERKSRRRKASFRSELDSAPESSQELARSTSRVLAKRRAQRVDNISRCAFPFCFTCFCLVYFIVFNH
ncbi:glycine receptor subunit alpha-4-like [Babylonia areolata]|uniref:glycine receptor subunit alpha-4-like n=1 Tax=Babylonia areolata TaxID=304850 RepID=UPI003FD2C613